MEKMQIKFDNIIPKEKQDENCKIRFAVWFLFICHQIIALKSFADNQFREEKCNK